MATDVLDFAALDTAAAAAATTETVDTSTQDTTTQSTTVDTQGTKVEGTNTAETNTEAEKNPDGTPKVKTETKEEAEAFKNTPDTIRKALKAFRDSSPENRAAAKELHEGWERANAYKKEFESVQAARDAKAFYELVGGHEGYEQLNQTVQSIQATDALLYDGDGTLIDNIWDDLKSEGKTDSFGKLATPFMDKLRQEDSKAYYSVVTPIFASLLNEVEMPAVAANLVAALNDPDPAKAIANAKTIAGNLDNYLKKIDSDEKNRVKAVKAEPTPEQLKFKKEQEEFAKQKQEFEKGNQTKFQNEVASSLESYNNKTLGGHLAPFLKMEFFKGFTRPNLVPLGNNIKANLFDALKQDKTYQDQMRSMWSQKSPDRAKISEYHQAKVQTIAEQVVNDTVKTMYPGYARGGSAAGRVAAATTKKEVVAKKNDETQATGKPQFVPVKPKNLDRERPGWELLEIAGKGYIPRPDGKGQLFVTWRK